MDQRTEHVSNTDTTQNASSDFLISQYTSRKPPFLPDFGLHSNVTFPILAPTGGVAFYSIVNDVLGVESLPPALPNAKGEGAKG
jgi:hypothetical protein